MAINFTPEQQKVIELHGRNILVSAAAGSGKTAVLVERIVHMVCQSEHPVDIDRLLVVTFTNAAAAEMRERIGTALSARLETEPENEHIQKQTTLLHNAQITTIDSFCLFVLRNNFNDIGIDPAFRIADEGEMELLRQEVLADLLEEQFAAKDEAFFHCVEVYCPGGRETALENHILKLYDFAMSYPWPEEWLEERKRDYRMDNIPVPGTRQETAGTQLETGGLQHSLPWLEYMRRHIRLLLSDCAGKLDCVIRLCEQPDGPYMYAELAEAEKEQLERLCRMEKPEELEAALPAFGFGRLPSKKDDSVSPEKRELAKALRGEVKDCLKDIAEHFFATPFPLAFAQMQECSRALEELLRLCLEFKKRLDKAKRKKNLLDFSDIEHFALNILLEKTEEGAVPTRTALEYREYFEEVLIDEYQDSNLVQEYLLKAVSGEEDGRFNRFMVGDVKQSIYKFRLARPELFLEKYDTYAFDGSHRQRIDLHRNFRSRSEVIATVNTVFEKIMSRELGGITYDGNAALYPGASYPENAGCESELILMEKPDREAGVTAKAMEALGIARRIKELRRSFQVTDKETGMLRPLRYQDIVVLLRTTSGWDEEFKEVFLQEGIPAYISSKTGYFQTAEIQNVMQFLRILDNPLQDIPFFGVLKSVFGGFSDEETAVIKSAFPEENYLYDCVAQYASAGREEALREKCAGFLRQLQKYRSYTVYMPIRTLMQTLFGEYGYLYYVAALPAGSQRLANVEMLLEKAGAFEKTSYYGLFHFIRYMEQLEKYQVDYGEANILDENADVVRIMSIHKSKGLEFPVVFAAGLSKRFNMQDAGQAVIMDVDLGIGTDYVNPERRLKNKTLRKNVLAEKMKNDNLAEEIRILYVALTRAKEKLIMSAVAEKAAEKAARYTLLRTGKEEGPLSYGALTGAASFLDFLMPVLEPACIWELGDLRAEDVKEAVGEAGRRAMLAQSARYADRTLLERLQEQFAYRYPHANLASLYTKTTVSELKLAAMQEKEDQSFHAFPKEEVVPYIPKFVQETEKLSGAARGSAFHKVMELFDFAAWEDFLKGCQISSGTETGRIRTEETGTDKTEAEAMPKEREAAAISDSSIDKITKAFVREELSRLQAGGRLSREYAEAVSEAKIAKFLRSPLARRMAAAERGGSLYREQPFVYGIPADRLNMPETGDAEGNAGFPSEETVLIQGIIDVFFEEEDGLVLADYKTDVVKQPQELAERYRVQLDYYEEALSKLTGKRVKERILYSFYLGCEVLA